MESSLAIAVIAYSLIFPVELPDKTFVATLVLSTRFRPLAVWIGVCGAFLVQTVISCTLGGLLLGFPARPVQAISAALFLIGGIVLWAGASKADAQEADAEREFAEKADEAAGMPAPGTSPSGMPAPVASATGGWRAISASFLVLFLAEFGDLSQILTANLVLQYRDPVAVGTGAFLALATVSGLGALLGRQLLARVKLSVIRRIGGTVCLVLATWTAWDVFSG